MDPKKETQIEKELGDDSPLKKLIKIFRTNTVVKHHFQGGGSRKPQGVASLFFKDSLSWNSNVIPGYTAHERMSRYSDYAEMISYPVIRKALQIYADEATQKDEDGKIIKITSDSKQVEELLQDLMDNVLQLNGKKIYKIVRDLCKYGDTFHLIDITTENGVVNLIQMPANEVEREEGFDKNEPTAVRFKWNRRESKEIPNAFVCHFRLDGDDMFFPFGESVLEAARRPWRQLCASKNTIIWTTGGYKTIDKIQVGDEIYSFDYKNESLITTKVKNVARTGVKEVFSVKTAHRSIDLTEDHEVLVCDSKQNYVYKKVKDLILSDGDGGQKYRNSDKLILPKVQDGSVPTFSLDKSLYFVKLKQKCSFDKAGVVSKLRTALGKEHIKNEHTFLLGKKKVSYETFEKLASEFNLNISDVEFYLKNSKNKTKFENFEFTPTLEFLRFLGFMYGDGWIKRNGIGFALGVREEENQYYINLCEKLFGVTGRRYEKENSKSASVLFDSRELGNLFEGIDFKTGFAKKYVPSWVFSLPQEYKLEFIKGIFDADGCDSDLILCLSNKKLITDILILAQQCGIDCSKKVRIDRLASEKYDKNFQKVVKRQTSYKIYLNLKTLTDVGLTKESVNHIEEVGAEEVYDIETESDLHNFIADGVVVHNCLLEDSMMVYRVTRSAERRAFFVDVMGVPPENVEEVVNKINQELKKKKVVNDEGKIDLRYGGTLDVSEDIIVPVRGNDTGTRIETLPGGQNLSDIEDVEFIQKNLFAALGIPKAFLTYDEGIGAKQVLTMEDVRFARSIAKVQEAIISELVKICLIHLYIKGVRGRDLINFKIKMTNPSTVAEMQKNELWRARMDLVQSAGQGVFDTTFIYKQFLRLSDDAIDLIRKGQITDKIFQAKLLSIESAGGQMGGMGGGMGGLGGGMGGMGGLGGGMGGMGGLGGMPPVGGDLGGAPSNVAGMPPLPEAFNPAANVTNSGGGKDLTRRDADERIATLRGHGEDEVVSEDDVAKSVDAGLDTDGIRRNITSPMGIAKEAANVHKEILEAFGRISTSQDDKYTVLNAKNYSHKQLISYLESTLGKDSGLSKILTEDTSLDSELEMIQEKVNKIL